MTTPPATVTLGTSGATLDDVVAVARHDARVVLADDVLETVGAVRRHVAVSYTHLTLPTIYSV